MPVDLTRERPLPPRERLGTDEDLAGFAPRLGAALIDGGIVSVAFVLVDLWLGQIPSGWVPSLLIGAGIGGVYWGLFEGSSLRGTPGKLAFGLSVVGTDRRPIATVRGLVRGVGHYVSCVPLWLGYVLMFTNDREMTLHDMLARTIVIRDRRRLSTFALVEVIVLALGAALLFGSRVTGAIQQEVSLPPERLAACVVDPAAAGPMTVANVPLPQPIAVGTLEEHLGTVELHGTTPIPMAEAWRTIERELRGDWSETSGSEQGETVTLRYEIDRWILDYELEACRDGTNIRVERF